MGFLQQNMARPASLANHFSNTECCLLGPSLLYEVCPLQLFSHQHISIAHIARLDNCPPALRKVFGKRSLNPLRMFYIVQTVVLTVQVGMSHHSHHNREIMGEKTNVLKRLGHKTVCTKKTSFGHAAGIPCPLASPSGCCLGQGLH